MTPIPATHADHDRLVVAAFAAGDATGAALDAAMAQVAACAECATLHHELRSIAAALPALPAAVRTRDFRLTPGQAASLRPSGWRRILAPLAGPRFAFAGPLGTGLATLGIAGFLVAGAAGLPLAGTAAAPATMSLEGAPEDHSAASVVPDRNAQIGAPIASAAPAAGEAPAASAPVEAFPAGEGPLGAGDGQASGQPGGNGDGGSFAAAQASPQPKSNENADRQAAAGAGESPEVLATMDAHVETAPATAPLVILAAVMLVAGFLLGGLRLVARRATA